MDVEQLQSFLEIARVLSFRQAAEHLHITQSTISSRIHKLEEELGLPLFVRRGNRGIQLSPYGEQFLPYVRECLETLQAGLDQLAGLTNSLRRLSISSANPFANLILPRLVARLYRAFPELEVEVIRTTGLSDKIFAMVAEHAVDLAFVNGAPDQYQHGLGGRDLEVCPVYADDLVVLANPQHPLAQMPVVPISHLNRETVILMGEGTSVTKLGRRYLERQGVKPVRTIEINHIAAMKETVETEGFLGLLPRLTVFPELASRELVALTLAPPPPALYTYLVYQRHRLPRPLVRQVKEWIVDIFAQAQLPCRLLLAIAADDGARDWAPEVGAGA
ncbi:MAG: LysR family transcriptional regulator [Firmicutes bacterium]|nr:LysR family transcriptional regulator [Alicyclobacillaceae bacterium]MCL6497926.1 LysR family transcriptional regulator [Bacillota bacterium]